MDMRISEGNYEHMGVFQKNGIIEFTFEAEKEDDCSIVVMDSDNTRTQINVPADYSIGSLRSIKIKDMSIKDFKYYFLINGKKVIDPYAALICGREKWNDPDRKKTDYEICCGTVKHKFVWGNDKTPEITRDKMLLYKLNVRSFSMDFVSSKKEAGTFKAIIKKIKYIKELGFTSILLMPVYEFEEIYIPPKIDIPEYARNRTNNADITALQNIERKTPEVNLWGYGPGNYFAVKASYAYDTGNAVNEFKTLIKKLHENNMECIMEMYFPDDTNHNLIMDAMRFWVREYHVDGFKLIGNNLPVVAISQDVLLSRTKILYEKFDFQVMPKERKYQNLYIDKEEYMYPVRKMLNHINEDMRELLDQQRKQGETNGFINYVSSNNGFTLADIFMYNDKHNEANLEDNQDGVSWNFSNNYGVEGPSRKKYIKSIRKLKWKNAMMLLFLAQGVPAIMAGDEFENSQAGNNNAYCQDNPIGWVNWKNEKSHRDNIEFMKSLIAFRKKHPVISSSLPYKFCDYKSLGCPDMSYHGSNAWISQFDLDRLCIGVMYCGEYSQTNDEYIYIAYNFYSYREVLALPKLKKGKKWYKIADTTMNDNAFIKDAEPYEDQQFVQMEPQAICILVGK